MYSDTDLAPFTGSRLNYKESLTVKIEAVSGSTITPGMIVYQAADGKIDDTGTVPVGTATRIVGFLPDIWEVTPL
jgi:hypothetical protein